MTKEDYWAGVGWVERVNGQNALLPALKRAHTRINEIYLKKILADIGEKPKKQPKRANTAKKEVDRLDPVFVKLNQTISGLFARRARKSNEFHDCANDVERANVSDDIRSLQIKIGVALEKRRYFQLHGKLPTNAQEAKKEVPLGAIELIKAYNANSARRSYTKRQIKKYALRTDLQGKRKLDELEKKLKADEHEFHELGKKIREAAV